MNVEVASPPAELTPAEMANASPINDVIAVILRGGVYISGAILIVGLAAFLIQSPNSSGLVTEVLRSSTVRPDIPTTFGAVGQGLRSGSAISIIELGVLVLLATPVLRVAASIVLFLLEADWLYTILTATVLLLLLISIFLLGAMGIGCPRAIDRRLARIGALLCTDKNAKLRRWRLPHSIGRVRCRCGASSNTSFGRNCPIRKPKASPNTI